MPRTRPKKPSSSSSTSNNDPVEAEVEKKRSVSVMLSLIAVMINCCWAVHRYQYDAMPTPVGVEQAGKRGFSEEAAMEHVVALTQFGPHSVGSTALDHAVKYVLAVTENIKETAHREVDVQVELFHVQSGANHLVGGLFKGKTLLYSDLKHVLLRVLPKYLPNAEEDAILVSSHIDTVFSTGGAGDCSSCVAVMLELARGISQWAHGFKHAVIFLFNTGEEEGLNGAHSFITQHPWRNSIRVAIDLEAMGIGGKSSIFQGGPDPWAIENFAKVAKYPSGQIIAQHISPLSSWMRWANQTETCRPEIGLNIVLRHGVRGLIKSATDFQVYKEVAGLSGLDFAYADITAVYHTKNDKLELLKPGSLQHLGENMLAFLLQTATSPRFPKVKEVKNAEVVVQDQAVFFDILGTYMVVYRQSFANMLHNSVVLQALLIWTTSLVIGGYPAVVSLGLSCLSVLLMWTFSLSFSVAVSFILPLICSSPVPYIASPWLVLGLFVAPAVLGALIGQHMGYLILLKYLRHVFSKRKQKGSPIFGADIIQSEAERWLFKAGFVQWLAILILGTLFKIGSSYVALVWLISPAFAYGFLEATLSPVRPPKPLKIVTLVLGMAVPIVLTAGIFIRLVGTVIGIVIRYDRNPGSTPEWLGNVLVSVFVATIVCLTMVYLLSYVHLSGAKRPMIIVACALFGLTLSAVLTGIVPPFTEDIARTVNVVHVVEATGGSGENQTPISYISLFSFTPGKLIEEAEQVKEEGFVCGNSKVIDFVTFEVKYGCISSNDAKSGWDESDVPKLHVESDVKKGDRVTQVLIDTKVSTRWSLAINMDKIEDFKFEGNSEELVSVGDKIGVDGWHIIQFSGGKDAPKRFNLTLFWMTTTEPEGSKQAPNPLLKLRTDVDRLTPKAERVLQKLPPWCTVFGKSTSPHTLAFLTSLPVDF
ncbi:hypothetical protein IFM89_034805 [Coptis chinensis]|uniref:Vacuolar membrane protease n=1 Tax=Coptis chinensis TaxID=261450 RepID=A0A835HAN9_9MAGN|nr:hypothetical protein IFM89_034805 [Coptis chinensis]